MRGVALGIGVGVGTGVGVGGGAGAWVAGGAIGVSVAIGIIGMVGLGIGLGVLVGIGADVETGEEATEGCTASPHPKNTNKTTSAIPISNLLGRQCKGLAYTGSSQVSRMLPR